MTEELNLKAKLYGKLAKVRAAVPPIPRDSEATVKMKSGGSYSYSYAKLESIVSIVNPVLDQHGIFYNWIVSSLDTITVVVVDLDTGYSIESSHKIGDDPENFQDRGKQLTYYSRYLLLLILGIVSEEDDDGAGYMSAKAGKSGKSGKSTKRTTRFRTSTVDEDEEEEDPDIDHDDLDDEDDDDDDDEPPKASARRGFNRRPPTSRRSW